MSRRLRGVTPVRSESFTQAWAQPVSDTGPTDGSVARCPAVGTLTHQAHV